MMKNRKFNLRSAALASASAAALMIGISGIAKAAPPDSYYYIDLTNPLATIETQTLYLDMVTTSQLELAPVSASVLGSSNIIVVGSSTGFASDNSSNSMTATAGGNLVTNGSVIGNLSPPTLVVTDRVVDLSALGTDGTNDGIGILTVQQTGDMTLPLGSTPITAAVTGGTYTTSLADFSTGSVNVSNNTIGATTTVNDIRPDYQVIGTIPTGYSSATTGSSSASFNVSNLTIDNSATVAITSVQTALNATAYGGSYATVSGATIGETISADLADLSITAPQTVDNNSVSADFTANNAQNIFLAQLGGAPGYSGSVLVSNNQANIETGVSTGPINVASVAGTAIGIDDTVGAFNGSVAGLADVSGNTVSSSASGNVAGAAGVNGGLPTIGNAIAFADGLSVDGSGSTAGNVLSIPANSVLGSTTSADLLLVNGQGNQGTQIGSSTTDNLIVVLADDVASTGSVNVSNNAVSSTANGNVQVGTIQATGASEINATAASANLQSNDATPIFADASGNLIGTAVGGGTDGTTNGTISVLNDSINASATGSLVGDPRATTVRLDATNLTSTGGVAAVDSNSQWYLGQVQSNTGGGISASNVQGNFGETTSISATADSNAIGAVVAANVTDGTINVNDNAIGADASGNVGYTSVALTGTNGAFSSGVSNTQYNANAIDGSVTESVIGTTILGSIDPTSVVVSGNSMSASGVANSATNSLSATGFATLTLGGGLDNTWTNPSAQYVYASGSNGVNGALALNNNQTNDGDVTANVSNSGVNGPFDLGLIYAAIGGNIGGPADNSPVVVTQNSASTSAIGAQATNTLTLGAADLSTASGSADQLASLGSVQLQGGYADSPGVAISSTIDLTGASGAIGILGSGYVESSSLTVSDNALSAFAAGNFVGNTLTATGTNYASSAPVIPLVGVSLTGTPVVSTQAEFALQNAQYDDATYNTTGTRTASITDAYVGVALTGSAFVEAAPITVSGNTTETDARNNYASNSLGLTGFSTLSTSAALQNWQSSGSVVTSTITEAKIGIDANAYDSLGSDLAVTDNSTRARAITNTAFNTVNIDSTVLGGNSGNTGATASMPNLPDAPVLDQTVTADYALGNYQGAVHDVTAFVSGVFQIDLTTGFAEGGSMTLSGNSMTALAQGNNATDTLNITAGTTTAFSGAVMSQQRSYLNNVSATAGYGADLAFGGVQVGSLDFVPVTVADNSLTALATNETATNTLNVSATANLVGDNLIGSAVVSNAGPVFQVTADFAVFNVQIALAGSATATANPGGLGVTVAGSVFDSPISVQNNSVAAQARVNDTTNTLLISGTNVGSTGSVANWQLSTNPATASVTAGQIGVNTGTTTGSPLNVSGNTFNASATGNNAANAVSVTATNYSTPINGASGGSVVGGGYQATADYTVLNMQQNNGPIMASATGLQVGINLTNPTPPTVTGSSMSASNNTVVASAYGNSASNSITLSASIGSMPSASLTSSQVNTASVTSSVTNVAMGIVAGAGSTSNAVSTNNSIAAVAIGNSSGNAIGVH